MNQPFVVGSIHAAIGAVPQVSSHLSRADRFGSYKARWSIGRMNYTVEPGLYALGRPDSKAPVLVTANYKMSFDLLREALPGRNVWVLVLDTKGVNVWCAAGKQTFGTSELVSRIESCGLSQVVNHKQLILPQLAAPGIAAHQVKKLSGFKVIYGPIRAKDLTPFFDAGLKATPQMRLKTFTMLERAVLIPVELVSALKTAACIIPVLLLLGGLGGEQGFWVNVTSHGFFAALALLGAVFAGAVLTPLLLPWVPGRAFSLKGLNMGAVTALIVTASRGFDFSFWSSRIEAVAWFLLIPAVTAYLAMNFTGASTYTSLSGVRKEMRWAVPMEIFAAAAGLSLWLVSRFIA